MVNPTLNPSWPDAGTVLASIIGHLERSGHDFNAVIPVPANGTVLGDSEQLFTREGAWAWTLAFSFSPADETESLHCLAVLPNTSQLFRSATGRGDHLIWEDITGDLSWLGNHPDFIETLETYLEYGPADGELWDFVSEEQLDRLTTSFNSATPATSSTARA